MDLRVYSDPVTTSYKIKDIADRSGFTPATLRYYEEIGLLPTAERTEGGYRLYDDRSLERLAFIARAKQLGCTLEEVADLTTAWDGGTCGPVQDRLRNLVADKLATAQQQIVELMILTSELRQAETALERHRPDGPCDETCGCVTDNTSESQPMTHGVSLIAKPNAEDAPIACTLGAGSLRGRLDEWNALLAHVTRREPINGGVRIAFDVQTPMSELMRLTAAEQDCCQFFSFAITVDTRGVALEVAAPADALPIVHSLFGVPS